MRTLHNVRNVASFVNCHIPAAWALLHVITRFYSNRWRLLWAVTAKPLVMAHAHMARTRQPSLSLNGIQPGSCTNCHARRETADLSGGFGRAQVVTARCRAWNTSCAKFRAQTTCISRRIDQPSATQTLEHTLANA